MARWREREFFEMGLVGKELLPVSMLVMATRQERDSTCVTRLMGRKSVLLFL